MTLRKLLPLTLSLLVVCLFGGSTASAAEFHASQYPATLRGEEIPGSGSLFEFGSFDVECNKTNFAGSMSWSSWVISLTPTFSECNVIGAAATINMNGCVFWHYAGQFIYTGETGYVNFDLACPKEKAVQISFSTYGKCEVHIPGQVFKSSWQTNYYNWYTYTYESIVIHKVVSGFRYKVTTDDNYCVFSGIGERSDGSYSADTHLQAYSQGGYKIPLILK